MIGRWSNTETVMLLLIGAIPLAVGIGVLLVLAVKGRREVRRVGLEGFYRGKPRVWLAAAAMGLFGCIGSGAVSAILLLPGVALLTNRGKRDLTLGETTFCVVVWLIAGAAVIIFMNRLDGGSSRSAGPRPTQPGTGRHHGGGCGSTGYDGGGGDGGE